MAKKVWLITRDQFQQLPDGTKLTDIFGATAIKGRDEIDQGVRHGHIAYGFLKGAKPKGIKLSDTAVCEVYEIGRRSKNTATIGL